MPDYFQHFKRIFPRVTPRSFRSMLGVSPHEFHLIYDTYCTVYPVQELFWCFSFLKMYDTVDTLHTIWGVSYDTYNNAVWKIIAHLNSVMDSSAPANLHTVRCGRYRMHLVVDATECLIEHPTRRNIERAVYSGYKRKCSLKYLLCVSTDGKYIVYVSGPHGGKDHDMTILRRSGFIRDSARKWPRFRFMGDKIFGWPVVTAYDIPPSLRLPFNRVRTRVECAIGSLKRFAAVSGRWRHSMAKHRMAFYLLVKMHNFLNSHK